MLSEKWRPFCFGLNVLDIEDWTNGWHFANNILKSIQLNENSFMLIQISYHLLIASQ